MNTSYSADVEKIDEQIHQAAQERTATGETIRIRIQPSIYRRALGQHRMWQGVSWTLDCDTVEEAIALREGLRLFFDQIAADGPTAVRAKLLTAAA